jgi:hypothetical protein
MSLKSHNSEYKIHNKSTVIYVNNKKIYNFITNEEISAFKTEIIHH